VGLPHARMLWSLLTIPREPAPALHRIFLCCTSPVSLSTFDWVASWTAGIRLHPVAGSVFERPWTVPGGRCPINEDDKRHPPRPDKLPQKTALSCASCMMLNACHPCDIVLYLNLLEVAVLHCAASATSERWDFASSLRPAWLALDRGSCLGEAGCEHWVVHIGDGAYV